jgi:hypothetical protein
LINLVCILYSLNIYKYVPIILKGKAWNKFEKAPEFHQDIYEEMLVKDTEIKTSTQINTSVIKAHKKLFYFSIPQVKIDINMNNLISACKY